MLVAVVVVVVVVRVAVGVVVVVRVVVVVVLVVVAVARMLADCLTESVTSNKGFRPFVPTGVETRCRKLGQLR